MSKQNKFSLHEIVGKARRKLRRSRRSGLCEGLRISCGNCRISLATSLIDSFGPLTRQTFSKSILAPRTFFSASIYRVLCLLRVTQVAAIRINQQLTHIRREHTTNSLCHVFYHKSMYAASVNQIWWQAYAHNYVARGSE